MFTKRTAGAVGIRRLTTRSRRLVAILSVVGVLATAGIVGIDASAAYATSYPSWHDVLAARHNKAKTAKAIKQINALIGALDAQVKSTQADAQAKGDAFQVAETKYFEAADRASVLQKQADKAKITAQRSEMQAGQLAAQLARQGAGPDFSMNLFLNGEDASQILANIGTAGKVSELTNEIYQKAVQDKNTAQSLSDQAKVAADLRKALKAQAQTAFAAAQAAAAKAQAAFDASQAHRDELVAQLAAITTKLKLTEAGYRKGVEARLKAARANGGAAVSVGYVSPSGWTRPAAGVITSGFGWRIAPIPGVLPFHSGTDIAGGCGIPIYAAHSGTVIYAGWYGTYGNFVLLDNGSGINTGYAHIVNGGILVHVGEQVAVGEQIARVGMTGAATGCHLHYEVRINGVAINSVPFMRAHGISLG
ncbi:M23 family metallopeptidase [Galbitalea soli]|uniref:M23 family metallopeptidase n=1 Tax=Galbitalea soli TaxID=1268042 RepID=A0A7C9PP70_9MICO|nr:M23 family metallopeptidase [Galbitalea soli]NEM91986.1 M23 family metallopeptidase [Galbitalea soli]NYJ32064.1 murein DD-endopeptidase MepM/ murein hydrolase activator NlpD [Galbitalea soli]